MINLNNKTFTSLENTENGEVTGKTRFTYHQDKNLVWAEYSGGSIVKGNLIATMDRDGKLDMRYHHVNIDDKLMTGICLSTPEILPDGRVRFYEKWKWTVGDNSTGESIIEEEK